MISIKQTLIGKSSNIVTIGYIISKLNLLNVRMIIFLLYQMIDFPIVPFMESVMLKIYLTIHNLSTS